MPLLEREGPLRDAWGKLRQGGYLGRTRRELEASEASRTGAELA